MFLYAGYLVTKCLLHVFFAIIVNENSMYSSDKRIFHQKRLSLLYETIIIHTIKKVEKNSDERSLLMSFALFFQEGSNIMGRSSIIGESSDVPRALFDCVNDSYFFHLYYRIWDFSQSYCLICFSEIIHYFLLLLISSYIFFISTLR
jgi:hypothetical protein